MGPNIWALSTYMASKVESERAVWQFVEEQDKKMPGFIVNFVSPFTMLGEVLHLSHLRGSAG